MKPLPHMLIVGLAASVLGSPTAGARADSVPPWSSLSTLDGAAVTQPFGWAVEGTSRDEGSGIFAVEVRFCPVAHPSECRWVDDLRPDCSYGCFNRYAWRVRVPDDLEPGVYRATVSAVDDAWNWETDGPSITITVAAGSGG